MSMGDYGQMGQFAATAVGQTSAATAVCEAIEQRERSIRALLAYVEPAEATVFASRELSWKSEAATAYAQIRDALLGVHRTLVLELESAADSAWSEVIAARQNRDALSARIPGITGAESVAFTGFAR